MLYSALILTLSAGTLVNYDPITFPEHKVQSWVGSNNTYFSAYDATEDHIEKI